MHNIKSVMVLLFVVFSVNVADAEPSSNMHYLMNEPVSMMDWGLLNIDRSLQADGRLSKYGNTITYYDWDKNRIIIDMAITGATSKEQAKEWCRDIVSQIRTFLGINERDGKPFFSRSYLYNYFSHEGFHKNTEPEGLDKELDIIAIIQVRILYKGNAESVKCEAPLLGTSIMFEEN